MLKSEIVSKFEEITKEKDATSMVTNAIAALSGADNAIVGYKPEGMRFRGNYWALSTWMDGKKIKDQYAPKPMTALERLMA